MRSQVWRCVYFNTLLFIWYVVQRAGLGKKNTSKRGIVAGYPLKSCSPTQGCFTWGNRAEDNYRLDSLLDSLSLILRRLVKQITDRNTPSLLYFPHLQNHPGDSEVQRFTHHTTGCVAAITMDEKRNVCMPRRIALDHFDIYKASLFSLGVCVMTAFRKFKPRREVPGLI